MGSIFQTLEQRILGFIKAKLKLGSLTVGNIQDVCKFHQVYLTNIIDVLGVFSAKDLNQLRDKYFATSRPAARYNPYPIILDLKRDLHGKAGLLERAQPFGAAIQTAKTMLKISAEISKNAKSLTEGDVITIDGARIVDVVMLGILREIDLFINYTTYLWEWFRIVLDRDKDQVPYRSQYLLDHEQEYMAILENVCDKAANYSFLKEIDVIKRKNANLVLYNNGSSFLPFLNRRNYTADNELHVQHGIVGLNIFAWIVSKWENWKYAQYKKTQRHREWLQQEEFRFKQILNEQDPNSPEAEKTKKYIEAYSAEIAKLDQDIANYEGTEA